MALRYSIIARDSDAVGFDELDWSLSIAETREEADKVAGHYYTEHDVIEVGIAEFDDAECCRQCGIGSACIGHIVDTLPGTSGLSHDEACRSAATEQGLDPLMGTLDAVQIPYRLETVGSYAMVVRIFPPQRGHLDITRAEHGWRVRSVDGWHEPGQLLTDSGSLPEVLTIIRTQPGWRRPRTDPPPWFPGHDRPPTAPPPAETERPPHL